MRSTARPAKLVTILKAKRDRIWSKSETQRSYGPKQAVAAKEWANAVQDRSKGKGL